MTPIHSRLYIALFAAALLPAMVLAAPPPTSRPAEADVFWSQPDMDRTPSGQDFHGPFTNGVLGVTAEQLPPHEWLSVEIDLYILRSWDGSVEIPVTGRRHPDGPDYLTVDIEKGPNLLYTTFSNTPDDPPGFTPTSFWQNFPSYVPGEKLRFQTGSAEHNTLGYHFPMQGPPALVAQDAVYKLHWMVPHTAGEATLRIAAAGLQNMIDENWGVKRVSIRPLRDSMVVPATSAEIADAFDASLRTDGDQGQFDAFGTLIRGREATLAWIAQNVQPVPIDGTQLAKLIADLGGDDNHIAEREAASGDIRRMGPQAEPALRDARRTAPGELCTRLDWALQIIGVEPITDQNTRRVMLATRVLEVIGSPTAMQLRKQLTQQ